MDVAQYVLHLLLLVIRVLISLLFLREIPLQFELDDLIPFTTFLGFSISYLLVFLFLHER